MTKITKRFKARDCYSNPVLIEDKDGDFVRYKDYAVLFAKWIGAEKFAAWYEQERNRLEKENEELRAELDAYNDNRCCSSGDCSC